VPAVRPPVVAGVGAVLVAGGAVVVDRLYERTTKGCSSVSFSIHGKGSPFPSQCFDPGLGLVGGLVLVIGGSVILLCGLFLMIRSWSQRTRPLPPKVEEAEEGTLEHVDLSPGFFALPGSEVPELSPPPGWYAVPPDFVPMWWNGTSWGTAPTLPPVPTAAPDE
jgi:hypothetical protein